MGTGIGKADNRIFTRCNTNCKDQAKNLDDWGKFAPPCVNSFPDTMTHDEYLEALFGHKPKDEEDRKLLTKEAEKAAWICFTTAFINFDRPCLRGFKVRAADSVETTKGEKK